MVVLNFHHCPLMTTSCHHAILQRTVVLSQRFAVMVAVYRHSVLMELTITYLFMKLIQLEMHMVALLCELLRSHEIIHTPLLVVIELSRLIHCVFCLNNI